MKCFPCVLVFVFIFGGCQATRTLTIGALFHEDEGDLMMAFKYALQRRNLFHPDLKFKAEIDFVDRADTFSVKRILCNWTNTGEGLIGIVGPTSPKTSCMAQSIAETLEIPHIQIHWKTSKPFPDSKQVTLNYYPDQYALSKGIAMITKNLDWKRYVILYENDDSLVRLQEVLKLTGKESDPVVVRQLIGPDYRAIFKLFKGEMVYNFIIDCEVQNVLTVLQHARDLGYLEMGYGLFLTNLDSHTVDLNILEPKCNITTVRIIDPDSEAVKFAVRDWEIGEYSSYNKEISLTPDTLLTEVALMNDAIAHLTESVYELRTTTPIAPLTLSCDDRETWNDGLSVASYMKVHPKARGTSGPMGFDHISGRRTDFVLELVEFFNNGYEKTCEWYPTLGSRLNCSRTEGKRQQQILETLQKQLIIVSSRIGQPYLIKRQKNDTGEELVGNARYEGYSMDLIDAIANDLNFKYKFEITRDNGYGSYIKEKKSWDGLVRDLLERKAHLAICDLTITYERRTVVDFSMPFMTLGIGILHSKANATETALFAFMDPLETEVWLYIVTFYISITVAMYLITRMAPGDWENPHPCDQNPEELENIWTLKNCLWLILGATMSQGCDILPKGISSRMAISMWWFFILIINSSYTANLAAFLTKDRMGSEIDSAEALAAQTKVKYGTVDKGSTQSFFREHKNNKMYEKMWTAMAQAKPSVFEPDNDAGVKRVLNAKNREYAFLMETTQIEFQIERKCNLKQVGGKLDNKGYGIAMPLNSPYRGQINEAILRLQENGTLKELHTKWWKRELGAGMCQAEEASASSDTKSWNISNVRGVFMVLGIGVGVAFLFAIVEFLWNVREVSLQEHISFWDAFKVEIKFAINIWVTEKRVKPEIPEPKEESEERSIAAKVLHGAGSFLKLDVFDKKISPSQKSLQTP